MATFFQSVYVHRPSFPSFAPVPLVFYTVARVAANDYYLFSSVVLLGASSLQTLLNHSKKSTTLTGTNSPRRQGFGRANTKSNSNLKAAATNGASAANTNIPPMPPLTHSTSMSSTLSMDSNYSDGETKRFFNEKYAKCSVKGNFLTLAAQPKNVELGEWLAHQCKDFQFKAHTSTG